MKVKIIETGEIVEAKRFKDLTEEEIQESTNDPELWRGTEVFVQNSPSNKNHHFLCLITKLRLSKKRRIHNVRSIKTHGA